MKTKLLVNSNVVVMLAFVIGSACTPVQQDVTSEIEEMNMVYMSAVKNQDVETLANLHTDDAVILPSNQSKVVGIDAIRLMWQEAFKYGMGYLELTTDEATAIGNTAHELGTYQYYTPDDQMVDEGKYIVVWQKEDNTWKIARDIWNSSMPMPTRATPNDTIALVITKVKPDKMDQLSQFATDVFYPAFTKHFPESEATSRLLKVVNPKDGEAELIYIIDPLMPNHVHDVKTILARHYSEEETDKYLEEFRSCLIDQEITYAVPMGW